MARKHLWFHDDGRRPSGLLLLLEEWHSLSSTGVQARLM